MKVTCSFDHNTRCLQLVPENDLERALLNEICDQTDKGIGVKVGKIQHPANTAEAPYIFRGLTIELSMNGGVKKIQ